MHKDAEFIKNKGGSAKLSELLGFEKPRGVRRIENWKRRGIPSEIKIQFPHIFLTELITKSARRKKT